MTPEQLENLARTIIVVTPEDIRWILGISDSPSHGFNFCAGSLSARCDNSLVEMAAEFARRIQFLHLRNTRWPNDDIFYEIWFKNFSEQFPTLFHY